jgi:hypothetical protein
MRAWPRVQGLSVLSGCWSGGGRPQSKSPLGALLAADAPVAASPDTDVQVSFSNTATWAGLSEVKGAWSHPAQRPASLKPVSLAMRSSSEGHT